MKVSNKRKKMLVFSQVLACAASVEIAEHVCVFFH